MTMDRGSLQPISARDRGGMTLVELLIVVTIIGLLVAIGLPTVDVTRYRITSAMQGMGTTLLAAQRYAVTRQHDVVVRFNQVTGALQIHDDRDNDGAVGGGERLRSISLGEHVVFGLGGAPPHATGAATITFSQRRDGLPAVTFHRNGSASEFGGAYFTSRRAVNAGTFATDTRLLRIERSTGRASWFRYGPNGWERGF